MQLLMMVYGWGFRVANPLRRKSKGSHRSSRRASAQYEVSDMSTAGKNTNSLSVWEWGMLLRLLKPQKRNIDISIKLLSKRSRILFLSKSVSTTMTIVDPWLLKLIPMYWFTLTSNNITSWSDLLQLFQSSLVSAAHLLFLTTNELDFYKSSRSEASVHVARLV